MTIQTEITDADWAAFAQFIVRSTARTVAGRLGRWGVPIGVGAALSLISALVGIALHFPSMLAGVIAGVFGIALGSWVRMRSLWPAADGYVLGPRQVTVSDDGLYEGSLRHATVFRWSVVRGVLVTDQHVFVMVDAAAAVIVPRRAFRTDAEREQFVSEIQRRTGRGTA